MPTGVFCSLLGIHRLTSLSLVDRDIPVRRKWTREKKGAEDKMFASCEMSRALHVTPVCLSGIIILRSTRCNQLEQYCCALGYCPYPRRM